MKQRGVTLLETILVLSLIAMIIIGGVNLYKNAKVSSDVNQSMKQILGLVSGMKSIYRQNNYRDFIIMDGESQTDVFIKSGAVPKDMLKNNKVINVFGKSVEVYPSNNSLTMFEVVFENVPKDVCYRLVTKDIGAEMVSSLTNCAWGMEFNLPDIFDDTSCPSSPLSLSQSKNLCENLNSRKAIIFTFR